MSAFLAVAAQTARLSLKGGGAYVGLVFYLAVVVVVPFAIGPDLNLLSRIGPAVLWIGALLATLLNLDRLFRDDRDDGSLDLLILAELPLELTVLAKCLGAWVATGLPLVIAAPVLGLLLAIEPGALGLTALTLLLGTPALTLIGAIGAALMTATGRGGPIVAVLVLPFTIPVLIFGAGAATAALVGSMAPVLLLAATSLIALVVSPVASAAALRAALD